MPKAKKSSKRKKFDYNQDRKKMRKRSNKKYNPRIENSQIRNAWDNKKSTAKNLLGLMGLAFDPNRTVPIKKSSLLGPDKATKAPTGIVTKPYVLNRDGPGREELLPGHAQTDQEEDQRVHAVPPGRLRRLHGLARRSVAAARGKAAEPVLDSFPPACQDVVV
ncbi:LOW QUALITY PROTEIN: nucleolar protein 16 [Gasterosteus aculeatus]